MGDKTDDALFCFMDQQRVCGPDCMSFRTVPDENRQLDKAQQHCVILSSIERTGRSTNILASVLSEHLRHTKVKDADAQRGAPPAAPNPLGGTGRG